MILQAFRDCLLCITIAFYWHAMGTSSLWPLLQARCFAVELAGKCLIRDQDSAKSCLQRVFNVSRNSTFLKFKSCCTLNFYCGRCRIPFRNNV
jgi:hypothetical protein